MGAEAADAQAWQRAQEQGTVEGYMEFLRERKLNRYSGQAATQLWELVRLGARDICVSVEAGASFPKADFLLSPIHESLASAGARLTSGKSERCHATLAIRMWDRVVARYENVTREAKGLAGLLEPGSFESKAYYSQITVTVPASGAATTTVISLQTESAPEKLPSAVTYTPRGRGTYEVWQGETIGGRPVVGPGGEPVRMGLPTIGAFSPVPEGDQGAVEVPVMISPYWAVLAASTNGRASPDDIKLAGAARAIEDPDSWVRRCARRFLGQSDGLGIKAVLSLINAWERYRDRDALERLLKLALDAMADGRPRKAWSAYHRLEDFASFIVQSESH
jgi:hypothetical protein